MLTDATRTLLTIEDVAEFLQVDRASVYRFIRQADLPAVRLGAHGHYRVDSRELDQWLEGRRAA